MKKSIQSFALIDGKPVFIKDYRHLVGNYRDRPKGIICPIKGCGCEMEMVLPENETIMRSHFRHKSKSVADHSPESIWHCDVKYHIAEQLKRRSKINIRWICKSGFCKGKHTLPSLLASTPNHINVDSRKIGKFLPDITLYKDDQPLAAIEVFNTHESTNEKISFYNERQLPWFEILVKSTKTYETIMQWEGGDGLQQFISRYYYPDTLPKHCPHCQQIIDNKIIRDKAIAERQAKEWAERESRRKQAEAFKQRIGKQLIPLLTGKKPISLGFHLSCSDCGKPFPQFLTFDNVAYFTINGYAPKLASATCDIVLYNAYSEYCGCILLSKKHSSNDTIKQELVWHKSPFIEISYHVNKNSFKIIDSSLHDKKNIHYTCDSCIVYRRAMTTIAKYFIC